MIQCRKTIIHKASHAAALLPAQVNSGGTLGSREEGSEDQVGERKMPSLWREGERLAVLNAP